MDNLPDLEQRQGPMMHSSLDADITTSFERWTGPATFTLRPAVFSPSTSRSSSPTPPPPYPQQNPAGREELPDLLESTATCSVQEQFISHGASSTISQDKLTIPTASQQRARTSVKDSQSRPYSESPLDKALAAFYSNRTTTPAATRSQDPNVNYNCNNFAKRWEHAARPSYRPAFSYLGAANPEIYGNPVAVDSLALVLPLASTPPYTETRYGDIDDEGDKKEAKGKNGNGKRTKGANAKAKSSKGKIFEVPAKTSSAGVEAASEGRRTRSMTKGSRDVSHSTKNVSEPRNLDAPPPTKRVKLLVSLPQESREVQEPEKLMIRLPPLAVVRARNDVSVGDENDAASVAAKEALGAINEDVASAPLENSMKENIVSKTPADENMATENDKNVPTDAAKSSDGRVVNATEMGEVDVVVD